MDKLKQLYIDEMLDLFKIEVAQSRLSNDFFYRYYDKTKPFQDLFKDTYKVFKINSSIQTKNNKLVDLLYSTIDYSCYNQIAEIMDVYKYLINSKSIEYNGNKVVFIEDKTIYNDTTKKGFNMRKKQNITKFFLNYFKTMNLSESHLILLNKQMDRISEYVKNDFETLYLRIGIEPKDYFRMGQWGYLNGSTYTSCTFIYTVDNINNNTLRTTLSDYKKAILTYMQLPTFVATLYDNEMDALNRGYTAKARQIFYYDEDIKSLLGLRGYGPQTDVQTIRENVAAIMATYQQGNYKDYLLENRVEGKKRKNIFPKSFNSFTANIIKKNEIDTPDIELGYLDTIHFNAWAKHVLIYNMPQQQSLFDNEINKDDILEKAEAKELKNATELLVGKFFEETQPYEDINYLHPFLRPDEIDDETRQDNYSLNDNNIALYDLFLNSKLLNEPTKYYENNRDKTHLYLREFYEQKGNDITKIDFAKTFFNDEWLDLIKKKTNINLKNILANDVIINENNEMER